MGGITGILVAFQLVTKGHRLQLLPIKGKTLLLLLGGKLHEILCKGGGLDLGTGHPPIRGMSRVSRPWDMTCGHVPRHVSRFVPNTPDRNDRITKPINPSVICVISVRGIWGFKVANCDLKFRGKSPYTKLCF